MPDSNRVMADAEALLRRVSPEGRKLAQRARARRRAHAAKAATRMALAFAAVVALAILWGVAIGPIGQLGFLAAVVALVCAWVAILTLSRAERETPAMLAATDLPQLPARTENWLAAQRALLPAPAIRLADEIGAKLEALGPQLATLDPATPAATAARKLLAEELPELIQGYARVPADLRRVARDGPAPDRQLLDGLAVVDEQLGRMSADLASGDLARLATQGRYLELKYKDNGEV